MNHLQNFIDRKFGKLTVISRAPNRGIRTMWNCRCDCGVEKVVWASGLKTGGSTSCGCNRGEANRKRASHGMTRSKLFRVWSGIISRCHGQGNANFKNYGARGIFVCDRWRTFSEFMEDMLPSYRDGLQIERKDNDKGYSPENCTWATRMEQNSNKRNNRFITVNGLRKTLSQWARDAGVSIHCLIARLDRGWPAEKAVSTPTATWHSRA